MMLPGDARAQQSDLETAVKATYLYKLAPFVQWPADTGADYAMTSDHGTTFNLCIAGRDPFGALLDDAVRGLMITDRPVIVRRMGVVLDGAGCHVLYVSPDGRQPAEEIIERVHGKPILTVTDGSDRPAETGIIDFVEQDGNIRFRIDLAKAEAGNLAISSKLLSLAVSVVEAPSDVEPAPAQTSPPEPSPVEPAAGGPQE
ncbi:hypothetical protein GCM10011342_27300 [Aquisalinus flavus]|uniref:Transmembrane protein n=2 Tax=Aquisalinus flavus TaxID=1526572 RepID=A0A8J2V5X7_9PROT|nr:hypothetical protein GCM10011342_27300 [Aquisalinus flavus]